MNLIKASESDLSPSEAFCSLLLLSLVSGHRVIRNMFEFQNFCINMMIIQKFWNSNIFLITLWPVTNQWLVTLHDLHVSMYFFFILNLVYRLYETLKSSFSCPSAFYWLLIFWSQSDWKYWLVNWTWFTCFQLFIFYSYWIMFIDFEKFWSHPLP